MLLLGGVNCLPIHHNILHIGHQHLLPLKKLVNFSDVVQNVAVLIASQKQRVSDPITAKTVLNANMYATFQVVAKSTGKLHILKLTFAGIPVNDHLFAIGYSVVNVLLDPMNSNAI